MIEIKEKKDCCGCTACMNICPVKAIEMKEDVEGFLYPVVRKDKCINCGMCERVCPILNQIKEKKKDQNAYAVNNKNVEIRKESTSGGAFSAISIAILEKGGAVYGAAFDKKYEVIHKKIEDKSELKQFRNSKYVQSNLNNVFKEIKELLENDRWVCFSGTPCQVEGLSRFLNKEYEKLLLVDVVCRAVPSPKLLRKYLEYIKTNKLNNEEISQVLFRDKSKYGYKYTQMTIKGHKKIYQEGVETDPYLRAFFKGYSIRPSCLDCRFKKRYRISDITMWDCFNIEELDKKLDDNMGTTRILIHSKKGKEIFNEIKDKFDYSELDPDIAIKGSKELIKSTTGNINREKFLEEVDKKTIEEVLNKYFPDNLSVKIERNVRKILVKTDIYKPIKKFIKKIVKR